MTRRLVPKLLVDGNQNWSKLLLNNHIKANLKTQLSACLTRLHPSETISHIPIAMCICANQNPKIIGPIDPWTTGNTKAINQAAENSVSNMVSSAYSKSRSSSCYPPTCMGRCKPEIRGTWVQRKEEKHTILANMQYQHEGDAHIPKSHLRSGLEKFTWISMCTWRPARACVKDELTYACILNEAAGSLSQATQSIWVLSPNWRPSSFQIRGFQMRGWCSNSSVWGLANDE